MMNIELVYASASRTVHESRLLLPEGSRLAHALQQAGWLQRFPEVGRLPVGIWNRRATPDTVLHDGDRVEVYRDLRVDPKIARRERFVGQGARSTGLFARRRPGSKAGY